MIAYEPIPIHEIHAARERIADAAVRTPLVRLWVEDAPAEIWLKLENLQPINSFKIRGAANAFARIPPDELAEGVWTCSAGNMAQGVAWCARRLGVEATIVVPDSAPQTKLDRIHALGARTIPVSNEVFFDVFTHRAFEGMTGRFVHPFSDPDVMAGNGTIGVEILEDLPAVDTVVVPYGGGGLSCGIGSAIRALAPDVRVLAVEPETAAPLAASWETGEPVRPRFEPSFVDGAGGPFVYPEMLALARRVLDGAVDVSLEETASAVRAMLERVRVVAEGAGGLALAAALAGRAGEGVVVCIVSGGNIDTAKLTAILRGDVP